MLTHEQRTEIYKAIPTEYVVRGITVPVVVRYANQWRPDEWPCIILEYTSLSEKSYEFLGYHYKATHTMNSTLVFDRNIHTYTLPIPRATKIYTVWGTLNKLEHEFLVDVDYSLVGNDIVWIGPFPDHGTTFYVKYRSDMIEVFKGGEKIDILNVNVMTKDWGDVKAGTFINGVMLADYIAGQLHTYMQYSMEPPINVVTNVEEKIKNLDALTEGEYQRRRLFIVELKHVEYVSTLVESIEEIEHEVTLDEMGN